MEDQTDALLKIEDGLDSALCAALTNSHSRPRKWPSKARPAVFSLLPSFVRPLVDGTPLTRKKLHPTAWLDGLRGVASLVVFVGHFIAPFHSGFWFGYGYKDNFWLIQLPIVRLLYIGHPMVVLFFIISGYTLSIKPLKLLRSQSWNQFQQAMSSSAFRRAARLFFPTFISTFMVMVMVQMGLYEYPRKFAYDGNILPGGSHEHHTVRLPTLSEQLSDWTMVVLETSDPFRYTNIENRYDVHLWTIPTEFRGSMILFITIVCLARTRVHMRFMCCTGIISYTIWAGRWEITMFIVGLVMAEINMIQAQRAGAAGIETELEKPTQSKNSRRIWTAVFVIGLFLLSQPEVGSEETPGYILLVRLVSARFFWEYLGAVIAVWSISNSEYLQLLFTNRFAQYLGDISFAIYLVHGPVLHTFGYSVTPNVISFVGKDSFFMYEVGFYLSALVVVPVTIWVADLFWRFVDLPVLRFIKYMEERCCI